MACRQEAGKADLIRIVRRPEGGVEVDRQGRLAGRGAYLHASNGCLEAARKRRALERALGIPVPAELWVELRPGALDEGFGDPGEPDSGAATSSGAGASVDS